MFDLVKVSVTLAMATLLNAIANASAVSAAAFIAAVTLLGFMAFLERKNRIEVERFESDVKRLNDVLTALSVQAGWKI